MRVAVNESPVFVPETSTYQRVFALTRLLTSFVIAQGYSMGTQD